MPTCPEERHRLEDGLRLTVIKRRDVLIGAAAAATFHVSFAALVASASAQDKPATGDLDAALKAIMGDAKPADGRIGMELPEIAENGNTVPYTLTVESPMTEADFVKAIHILATGNPQTGIASFNFTPASGKAFVSGRMRLARSQEIVTVAELSNGKFLLGRRSVKVTIGGCGG